MVFFGVKMGDFVKAVLAVVVLRLLQSRVSVEAWGADGHHATCLLAEVYIWMPVLLFPLFFPGHFSLHPVAFVAGFTQH